MPVLNLAMCSLGQRGCDSRVPGSSVKKWLGSGNICGTSRVAVTLGVFASARVWRYRKWGKIKQRWGQLTDDDLSQINGRREQGRLARPRRRGRPRTGKIPVGRRHRLGGANRRSALIFCLRQSEFPVLLRPRVTGVGEGNGQNQKREYKI